MTVSEPAQGSRETWPVLLPVGYALSVTLYVALRYGYRWGEQDTGQFITAIHQVVSQATVMPSGGAYPHGYGYQAVVASLVAVTGLSVTEVGLIVLPFLSVVTGLIAFVTFRALTGSALLGGLSALLLFIQPEFVFVFERGSHEKATLTIVLLLVFLLIASLTRTRTAPIAAGYIVAFYLSAWALIATNAFFASSFIASLTLALAGGLITLWIVRSPADESRTMRRLIYTILSCFALLFVFIVYVYSSADYELSTLRTLIDKLSVLFLSFEPQSNPYATITASSGAAWIAPWVYPVLTAFNWLILLGAAITWVVLAVRFKREGLEMGQRRLLLLWLLAAAFAFEVLISVIIDTSGFLASNLQIRLFPLFMLFGIPLNVLTGAALIKRIHRGLPRAAALASLGALLAVFAATGVLKATNDPIVSNKWLFFTGAEQRAIAWADSQLARQEIWEGFDERLREMQIIHQPADADRGNRYVLGALKESTRYIIMSDVIQQRSIRLGMPAPGVAHSDRIFDDGRAQVLHLVPETPYQP